MSADLQASIALALLSQVAYPEVIARRLSASQVLSLPATELAEMTRSTPKETAAARDAALKKAEREADFITTHNLTLLTPLDPEYPQRLLGTRNEARMLTRLGSASLSPERALAVVGTRKCTPYGVDNTSRIINRLAELTPPVTIISGLAYGIDAAAHEATLKAGMPTIAVVAHGLGMIYPAAHRDLAGRIVAAGGAILTAYTHDLRPFRNHFLERNGIIAALSDATLVVESDIRGGALGTAAHAAAAGRKVFALPGRTNDQASAGCNKLIRTGRAQLITCGDDIAESAEWQPTGATPSRHPSLFPTLEGNAARIADALRATDAPMTIDEITRACSLPVHVIMAEVAEMEFRGLLLRWPGSRLQLNC